MRQTRRASCLFLNEESKKKMHFPGNENEKLTIRNDQGFFFQISNIGKDFVVTIWHGL